MKSDAVAEVKRLGGDANDETAILSQYIIQFGTFKGQPFKWLLENGFGHSGWLVDNMRGKTATTAPLSHNKHALRKYLISFPEGKEVVALKARERLANSSKSQSINKGKGKIFAWMESVNVRYCNCALFMGWI